MTRVTWWTASRDAHRPTRKRRLVCQRVASELDSAVDQSHLPAPSSAVSAAERRRRTRPLTAASTCLTTRVVVHLSGRGSPERPPIDCHRPTGQSAPVRSARRPTESGGAVADPPIRRLQENDETLVRRVAHLRPPDSRTATARP